MIVTRGFGEVDGLVGVAQGLRGLAGVVQKPAGELRVPSSDPLRLRPGEGADLGELPDDGVDDERRAGEIVHSGVLGELPTK